MILKEILYTIVYGNMKEYFFTRVTYHSKRAERILNGGDEFNSLNKIKIGGIYE